MSDWGIKVSNAGTSILSTDIRDQIMNSQYSMFKYHSDGTVSGTLGAGGTIASGTISHNLGYVPAFIGYVTYPNDSYQRIVPSIPYGVSFDYYTSAYADTANVYMGFHSTTPLGQVDNDIEEYYDTLIGDGQQWIVGQSGVSISGAFRFENVTLSGTATIVSAVIDVVVNATGTATGDTSFTVYGIDEDNTGSFSSNPMGRDRTTATYTQNQSKQSTPYTTGINVKTCLEEILARPGWSSGNAMGFLTFDNSSPTSAYIASNSSSTKLSVITSSGMTITFRGIIFKDKVI